MDKKVYKEVTFRSIELEILKFYLGDYLEGNYARQIARLLEKNHRTVSLALAGLEEKGILNHKMVGRVKEYYINFESPLTRDYLINAEFLQNMKFMEKHFFYKKLLTELTPNLLMSAPVILFGSYAKGEETSRSDIDLLIIRDGNENKVMGAIKEFADRHNKEVHLHKMKKEDFESGLKEKDHFVIEILKNHIIWNNSPLFVDIFWRYFYGK
ncbi:MAG: nucleotidyltransferase domain-containing protein [Candidatus Aenigmarchaeota archaeon]|nr:nucleotidyltransferase domain-containing protein [Candidatus Aenigmarchaeota archaeon]